MDFQSSFTPILFRPAGGRLGLPISLRRGCLAVLSGHFHGGYFGFRSDAIRSCSRLTSEEVSEHALSLLMMSSGVIHCASRSIQWACQARSLSRYPMRRQAGRRMPAAPGPPWSAVEYASTLLLR